MWSSYDILGRPTKTWTQGASPADTVWTYYGRVFVDSVKDSKGQVYRSELNALGWPTRMFDPNPSNGFVQYEYNQNGWLTGVTNRRGQSVFRTYDALGRVLRKWGTNTVTDEFAYSPNGLVVIAENSASKEEIYRRSSGWIDSVVSTIAGKRYRTWYRPDGVGRLDSMQINGPTGGISFAGRRQVYDLARNRVASLRVNGITVSFGYTGELNVDTIRYPDPIPFQGYNLRVLSRTTNNEVWSDGYTFGPLSDFSRGYGYDSLGRIKSTARRLALSAWETTRFKYDVQSKLIGMTHRRPTPCVHLIQTSGTLGHFVERRFPLRSPMMPWGTS